MRLSITLCASVLKDLLKSNRFDKEHTEILGIIWRNKLVISKALEKFYNDYFENTLLERDYKDFISTIIQNQDTCEVVENRDEAHFKKICSEPYFFSGPYMYRPQFYKSLHPSQNQIILHFQSQIGLHPHKEI